MKQKGNLTKSIVVMLVFFGLIAGCAMLKNNGALKLVMGKMTIDELVESWQNYGVYYAGLSIENPSAVMFDTKIDGRRVTSDKWVLVTKKSVVEALVKALNVNVNYPPDLWKILGPRGTPFGYLYSYWNSVEINGVDNKTIWIGDLPLPPIDYGPGIGVSD